MREPNESNLVKSTVVAGVLGSAATALFFLMRNKNTRKKILNGIDNAWQTLSKNEVIDEVTNKTPIRKVLDSITGGNDDQDDSEDGKKRASRNGK